MRWKLLSVLASLLVLVPMCLFSAVMGAFLVTYPHDRIKVLMVFGWFVHVARVPAFLLVGVWLLSQLMNQTAAVVQEEIFGPCCHIRPFDSEDEVVKLANATDYGLATTIWTSNLSRAHRVASQLEAGMVFINRYGCYDFASPFGGWKQSGLGREGEQARLLGRDRPPVGAEDLHLVGDGAGHGRPGFAIAG